MRALVITTINPMTDAIRSFIRLHSKKYLIIIAGDVKTPEDDYANGVIYVPVSDEGVSYLNHYSAKNNGYLKAMECGVDVIAETDDDNFPLPNWGDVSFDDSSSCFDTLLSNKEGRVINAYEYAYDDRHIWPRGFPLSKRHTTGHIKVISQIEHNKIGVWQGLIRDDPDVDAVQRLTSYRTDWSAARTKSFLIAIDNYSPFNSQNTFWNKRVFPLMYIPCTVNSRFSDILRGYVAQRIMRELDMWLGFSEESVYQLRNEHDLYKDFLDEVEMQTKIPSVIDVLNSVCIENENILDAVCTCYEQLIDAKVVSVQEMIPLLNWLVKMKELDHDNLYSN